jgi:hypothetical protein
LIGQSTGKSSLTISPRLVGVGAYVSAIDSEGRTIWIVDAHRGDGKRFIVRAEEILTAFFGTGIGSPRLRQIGLTGRRDFPMTLGIGYQNHEIAPAARFTPIWTVLRLR